MYKLKELEPVFLEHKVRQDSSLKEDEQLVSVLYEVTRADTPMLDGDVLTWDSILEACEACQQDIVDGAMFGYLGHQPKAFDNFGNAIGFIPDPTKRLFKASSMYPDYQEKRILSWADYLNNPLGKAESKKIRQENFRPKVSMTSFVAPSAKGDGSLDVTGILNYDQVPVPNMRSAVMLRFNSSPEVEAKFRNNLEKYYLEQANQKSQSQPIIPIKPQYSISLSPDPKNNSRSGKLIFYQNSSRTGVNHMKVNFQSRFIATKLAQHSAILSLEAVYGMALGGWLTQEGLIALKYWCDMYEELVNGSKVAAAASTDAEVSTEATMMATDARSLNDAIVEVNKTYDKYKKAEAPSFLDAIKQHSAQPVIERENPTIVALTNQVSELAKVVSALATDGRPRVDEPQKAVEKPKDSTPTLVTDSREDIEKHVNTLLASDVVKLGDLNYQKASFTKENIEKIKQNSVLARTKADAETSLANGFALLSQHNVNNFLNGKGFDINNSDLKPKGTTATAQTTVGKSRYDQFQEAYLDNVAKNDYTKAQQIRQNMASAKYQEKVKPIKQMAIKNAEGQLKQIAEYASSKGIRTDGVFDQGGVHGAIDKCLELLPKGSGNRNMSIRTDASAPLVVDSTLTVMLPTLSLVSKLAPVEDLDILLTLYSGLGSDSLDSTPPIGSPAFGRVFAFTQDYPAIATGNNDDPDNLELLVNNQGKNKLQQIAPKDKREEFVAHDFGASIELARQHMVALMEINYDLAANTIRRATEKMNRDQITRGIRALFRRAGDANAKARTDTVANVAPSGSQAAGALNYTGEYKKRSGSGVAINLAGKTFGGTASNIDAALRVLGGQTSGGAIKNTPIASFRTEYSALKNGDLDTVKYNEITVVINSVDISAHRGILATDSNGVSYIAQRLGGSATPKWAEDEDGFILLASGAGQGTDPTSPQIVVTYYELTNVIWQKIDSGTDDQQKFWREYIYNVADQNSKLHSKPNYARGDMVLHDSVIGTQIRKADLFRNDSQLGELEILSEQMKAVARYDWETHISTNATLPFGSGRSLIMKQNYGKMASQIGQFGNWYQGQTVVGSDIITLDAILADIYMREVFGISLLADPNNQNKATGFPFTQIINWGILKSQQ